MGDSGGNEQKLSELTMNGLSNNNHSVNGNSSSSAAAPSHHQQVILEQERFMPIANISRIMKRVLPEHAKLSKESKECIQECITEFFLFVTSEAAEKCNAEKRKTITGEDLLASMETLGFDNYLLPLRALLKKHKEATRSERPPSDLDESIENHGDHLRSAYASPPSPIHLIEDYRQQTFVLQEAETINHHQQQRQQQQPQQQQSQQQNQPQEEDIDDIINYLPPNFRRVTEIYVDTITEQHYISATSPGASSNLH
uniref:Transcription factor CBF/NF-Y/archaeal histone domain-containing protein n=1 Tax=Panagrolaimus superbus TaxID=310955 RepID=A0A914Y454_9BILA